MFGIPNPRTVLLASNAAGMSTLLPAVPDPAPPLTPAEQRDLVPAYFYPDLGTDIDTPADGDWKKMCDVARPGSIIIANHDSGEGGAPDTNYEVAVQYCQNRGFKVMSYVATTYGQKPWSTLDRQVQNQMSWYKPDGIFLDEMMYFSDQLVAGETETAQQVTSKTYYTRISNIIRSGPRNRDGSVKMVIGNPGNVIEEQGDWGLRKPPWWWPLRKHPVLDILVVVEKKAVEYKTWPQPSWVYPGNARARAYKFAHMVHTVKGFPVSEESAIGQLSRQHHAGYVYLTTEVEGTSTDPHSDPVLWNELSPSWFSRFPQPGLEHS